MIDIRRIFTHVEQIHHEFGPVAATPLLRGAIGVVLTNPFAGRYEPDLLPMMNALQPLGIDMAELREIEPRGGLPDMVKRKPRDGLSIRNNFIIPM